MSGDWQYYAVDLKTRKIKAELDLAGVAFDRVLNDHGTFSASIGLRDKAATPEILNPAVTIIAAVHGNAVEWGGVLMTLSKPSGSEAITLGCVGVSALLERRYLRVHRLFDLIDSQYVVNDYVSSAQDGIGGDLGLILEWRGQSAETFTEELKTYDDHKFAELIKDMSQGPTGFDWYNDMNLNFQPFLICESPKKWRATPYIFDYDVNVSEYAWTRDAAGMANSVIVRGKDPLFPGVAEDTIAQRKYVRLESVISAPAVSDKNRLQQMAEGEMRMRALPYDTVSSLTLIPGSHPDYTNLELGDEVTVRINDGMVQIDNRYRIESISTTPQPGTEKVTLALRDREATAISSLAQSVVGAPVIKDTKVRFTDTFTRANSTSIGNGWTQALGDFSVDTQRVIAVTAPAYLGRPWGHLNSYVEAYLRSPDGGSPAVFLWAASANAASSGYRLAFSASSTTTNLVLYRNGVAISSKHYGATGASIGNVGKTLRLQAFEVSLSQVQVRCYVNGVLELSYNDTVAAAPTGTWAGGGIQTNNDLSMDSIVMQEL